MLEAYLELLELGYYEAQFAFEGLTDENVWRRPAPNLLSIGEQAGHIAYWEAVRLAGDCSPRPDLDHCKVKSLLIDHRFAYYPLTLAKPPSEAHLAMAAVQVWSELQRIHREAVEHFRALNPDLKSGPPGAPPEFTYGEMVKYLAFHIGYHTGQIYTVRHLLGDTTTDN